MNDAYKKAMNAFLGDATGEMRAKLSKGERINNLFDEFRSAVRLVKTSFDAAPIHERRPGMKMNLQKAEGYVYLALSDTGHIKIGRSKSPEKRIKHFRTIMPVNVRLMFWFYADNYAEAERFLHEAFADNRVNGEWFALTRWQISAIMEILCFIDGVFHTRHMVPSDTHEHRTIESMIEHGYLVRTYDDLPY